MLALRSIKLTDILTFKQVNLPLKENLFVVRGLNKDRKSKNSRNAAGKSSLFSTVPNLLFSAPPSSIRRNTAKTLHGKSGVIELSLMKNGKPVVMRQETSGRSLKFTITQNGRAFDYRESKQAKLHIDRILNINEESFYAFYYIDVLRANPLLRGTSAKRFEFFENVCNLQSFDALYALLAKKYAELKTLQATTEKMAARYAEDVEKLPNTDTPIEELKNTVKTLQAEHDAWADRLAKAMETKAHVAAFMSIAGDLVDKKIDTLKTKVHVLEYSEIKSLQDNYRKAVEYEASKREFAKLHAKKERLKEKLAELKHVKPARDVAKVKHELLTAAKEYNEAKQELSDTHLPESKIDESYVVPEGHADFIEKAKRGANSYDTLSKNYRKAIQELSSKIVNERVSLEDLQGLEEGDCPTCYQEINAEHKERCIDEAAKKLKKLQALHKSLVHVVKVADRAEEIELFKHRIEDLKEASNSARQRGLDLKKELELAKEYAEKVRLKDALADFEMGEGDFLPKKPKLTAYEAKTAIEAAQKELETAKRQLAAKRMLETLPVAYGSVDEAKAALRKAQTTLNNADKFTAIKERLDEAKSSLLIRQTLEASLNDMKASIDADTAKTRHMPIYEKLKEAYGARGLRIVQIELIAKQFIENMNALAPLIYPESMKFSYRITPGAFDIFAERNNKPPADIRTLSGSESRAFLALCVLAFMPFVPANKRLSFIIFDEIESGMDEQTRKLFVDEFLPKLQIAFPLIVLITPMSRKEFLIPEAKEILVTKENGVSTVSIV